MNRALRAATMGVLLVSPLALAGCSAGQVTQTATQERDKVGAMAQTGDLALRAITLEHPEEGVYEAGDDATLRFAVVNTGQEDDTLTGISGEGFAEAVIESADSSGRSGSGELEVPARAIVTVGEEGTATVTLTDLDEELTAGQFLELEFEFENAGEVTVRASVSAAEEVRERGEHFDFHHEEHGTGDDAPQEQVEVAGGVHN